MWFSSRWFAFVFISVTCVFTSAEEPKVNSFSIRLTKDNFDQEVAGHNILVLFYSPQCELSQKFLPKYEKLAEIFNKNDDLKLAGINCDESLEFCTSKRAEPLDLYLYSKEDGKRIKFNSVRTQEGLSKFFIKHLGDDILDGSDIEIPKSLAAINELTDETFNDHVAIGQHFVKFYAPWCGHCQRLAPAWDELASALEYDDSVSISKIDCTQFRPICQDFEVKGYPTLLWIVEGKKVEKYTGARSIDDLKAYVERVAGSKAKREAAEAEQKTQDSDVGAVVQLTMDSFEHGIAKGVTFVKFFAPWCGHCKRMAPTWDELALKFVGNHLVKIAKVDCTLSDNKELCSQQEVNGFPTILIYKDGSKLSEYNGNRSLDDLYEFVKGYSTRDEL